MRRVGVRIFRDVFCSLLQIVPEVREFVTIVLLELDIDIELPVINPEPCLFEIRFELLRVVAIIVDISLLVQHIVFLERVNPSIDRWLRDITVFGEFGS